MKIQLDYEIRTLGIEKPGNLAEAGQHLDEESSILRQSGFSKSRMVRLVDTPITRYFHPEQRALVISTFHHRKKEIDSEGKNGFFYEVIGPKGFADNIIETLRAMSKRQGYSEVGGLGDTFLELI